MVCLKIIILCTFCNSMSWNINHWVVKKMCSLFFRHFLGVSCWRPCRACLEKRACFSSLFDPSHIYVSFPLTSREISWDFANKNLKELNEWTSLSHILLCFSHILTWKYQLWSLTLFLSTEQEAESSLNVLIPWKALFLEVFSLALLYLIISVWENAIWKWCVLSFVSPRHYSKVICQSTNSISECGVRYIQFLMSCVHISYRDKNVLDYLPFSYRIWQKYSFPKQRPLHGFIIRFS